MVQIILAKTIGNFYKKELYKTEVKEEGFNDGVKFACRQLLDFGSREITEERIIESFRKTAKSKEVAEQKDYAKAILELLEG